MSVGPAVLAGGKQQPTQRGQPDEYASPDRLTSNRVDHTPAWCGLPVDEPPATCGWQRPHLPDNLPGRCSPRTSVANSPDPDGVPGAKRTGGRTVRPQ